MQKLACCCSKFRDTAQQCGHAIDTDGHVALILVNLGVGGHSLLCPDDLVPVSGCQACTRAVSDITDFSKHLNVPVPPLNSLHPPSLFPETVAGPAAASVFLTVQISVHSSG